MNPFILSNLRRNGLAAMLHEMLYEMLQVKYFCTNFHFSKYDEFCM